MEFAIIFSEKDIAGMNIKSRLLEKHGFFEGGNFSGNRNYCMDAGKSKITLYTISEDTVFFEEADTSIKADYFVFATRHQSKSGEKTLSMHFPGNFGKAEYGGKEKELSVSAPFFMKHAFAILGRLGKDSGYAMTLEATHHGPLCRKPVMFIEIGSTEQEWQDKKAAGILAATIIETISTYNDFLQSHSSVTQSEIAICFGGLHYCDNFNKAILMEGIALSHICPKYNVSHIDSQMLLKMIFSSEKKATLALLDWKGISGEDRKKLIEVIEKSSLPWKKTKSL